MAKKYVAIRVVVLKRMGELGWSKNRLAVEAKICASRVNPWINGDGAITDRNLNKIFRALGLEVHAANNTK